MINIHDVVEPMPNSKTTLEGENRYLGRDKENYAHLIRVDTNFKTGPYRIPFSEFIEDLYYGQIYVIKNYTIYGFAVSENQLKASEKVQFEKNMQILWPVFCDEEMLFNPLYRSLQLEELAERLNKDKRSVRRLYYRFLGSGMNKFSLAPLFNFRGGPQKSLVRRGPDNPESKVASVVIESKLQDGVIKFLKSGRLSVLEAYVKTLTRFFNKGIAFVDNQGKALPIHKILRKNPHLPTLRQFEYVKIKMQNEGFTIDKHPRHARNYEKKEPYRGKARDLVPGPGYRFEIDATGMQIELVSRLGRARLIGSPNLYFVIDSWSTAICGYVLSPHSAGWSLAAKALLNCFVDKERVFRRLNLPYTSEDWPMHHIPSRLAADRGEMKNIKPEVLCKPAGINFEIGPPMHPTWRGTVESAFKNMKHGDFYKIAGRHPKFSRRGDPNGKNTAALTIDELEYIIVEKIMDLNRDPAPEDIVQPEMMEDKDILPTRVDVYRWGIENRPGYARTLPEKDVLTLLMTRSIASVTRYGIKFRGFTYISPRLHENGFLQKAAKRGHYKIEIAHDEHFADILWFYDPILDNWVHAENNNAEIRRKKISLLETKIFRKDLRKRLYAAKINNAHLRIEKATTIHKIVQNAQKEAAIARRGKTKLAKQKRIRKNRQEEIRYYDELVSIQ